MKSLKKKSEKGFQNMKRIDDEIDGEVHRLYGIEEEVFV